MIYSGKNNNKGFTLIELVVIMLVIGILAGVAITKMAPSMETARVEATKTQLDAIARAIAGNPMIYANGTRIDFGYVGDIGALPPDLNALAVNPGYATWKGPYIKGAFESGDYQKDGWNSTITYSGTLLRSTGSGSNIDKIFIASSSALLSNNVTGVIVDADRHIPNSAYKDSVLIVLSYPDGSGGIADASGYPNRNGYFTFGSVPVGNHELKVIYLPDNDTTVYSVTVNPGRDVNLDIIFPYDLW